MSRLPPIPPASRPTHGPDGVPKELEDVTHRVRHQAQRLQRQERDAEPGDTKPPSPIPGLSSPMLNAIIAGFAGYVIGYLTVNR